jgi:hypothetical protein
MAITKTTVVDQITVTENGIILYREATKIIEDGVELTKTYHRSSLTPGQDLTGQPAQVVAIANTVWTRDITTNESIVNAEDADTLKASMNTLIEQIKS